MKEDYRMVVDINQHQIARYKTDMEAFCTILNKLFATMREEQYLQGEITLQMVQEIAVNDTTTLCKCIDEECKEAAGRLAIPFAKREMFKMATRAKKEVKLLVKDMHAKKNEQRLYFGLSMYDEERPKFLCVKNGLVGYDAAAIEERFTDTISGEKAKAFVERLKTLVSEIKQFNNDVKNMSKGYAAGVGVVSDGTLLALDDFGTLHVSVSNLKLLDFDAAGEQQRNANLVKWHGFSL